MPVRTTRTVPNDEAVAALLETADRLRSAREAIADLMTMENARTADLHADDDHVRRLIRSLDDRRRRLMRDMATKDVAVSMDGGAR
jgi:acyl-CoA reductase-like NAD-dependent aldehyde dehydrogenase